MRKGWDEFFYFSKSDRRALLLLMGILIGVVITSTAVFLSERKDGGKENVHEMDMDTVVFSGKPLAASSEPMREVYRQEETYAPETFYFDPNTADSTELLRLGLRPWQVKNIYKYRAKGGRYHRPEDFARLYGLTQGDYERLYPYIRIADEYRLLADVSPALVQEQDENSNVSRVEKYDEGTRIDLNAADTSMLKKIPGIGSYYARSIVGYRERLGGFVSVAQLVEVEGLPDSVERWFVLSPEVFRPLYVNRLSVDKLRRHPYLSFSQGRVIVEHRRKYGAIKKLQALALYEEFTPTDLERLQPYVSFDE